MVHFRFNITKLRKEHILLIDNYILKITIQFQTQFASRSTILDWLDWRNTSQHNFHITLLWPLSYFSASSILNLQRPLIFGGTKINVFKFVALCKMIFTNSSWEGRNFKLLSTSTLSCVNLWLQLSSRCFWCISQYISR